MFRHIALFYGHEIRATMRNPAWSLFGIMQPLFYLVLFAPLVANTTPGVPFGDALRDFTPGLLVMVALFSSLFVGFGIIGEIGNGVLERIAVSPASRPAIVLGRTLRDVTMLILQSLVLVVIAMAFGMRAHLPGLLVMLLLMAVTGVFASGLSYGLALAVRDVNALSPMLSFLSMPLILLTGIMLPMSFAPAWMQAVVQFNPLYHTVEAGKALFRGDFGELSIAIAFVSLIALAMLTTRWSISSIRRITL
ncbi:ABC transporter permease [Sinosporangium siamense]|uniref:Transport permease protein n=1 Tax=Sinosporangium siamense TaxID=1367973 RepID=A0A919RCZ7_9ACTN|nr:ABC transporter permease [Sinosporangium siamense]GII91373.1 transport permease protein [Sinosporangium siamense]